MPPEKGKISSINRKRGPYKQYSFKGNDSGIPRRTISNLKKRNNVGLDINKKEPDRAPQSSDRSSYPVIGPSGPGPSCSSSNNDGVERQQGTAESEMLVIEHDVSTKLVDGLNFNFEAPSELEFFFEEQCDDDPVSPVGEDETGLDQQDDSCVLPDDSNDEEEENLLSEDENFRLQLDGPFSDGEQDTSVLSENIEVGSDIESNGESEGSENEAVAMAPDLNLSVNEKIKTLLILATMKRHNLTYSAAETIMKLSSVLSGNDSEEPQAKTFHASRHILKRVIEKYSCAVTEHHVCPDCGTYIGLVGTLNFFCRKCHKRFNTKKNRRTGNMFLYMPLKDQLQDLLQYNVSNDDFVNRDSREKICATNYEDIMDGKMYKEKIPDDFISITVFIDGLQVSSTSRKKSAWPILICINELKLHLRRKYILLVALWLSKKKPNMKEYLKPFIQECLQLALSGVTFKRNNVNITIKVKILMAVSDSIARPLLRNSHQFNGKYGCGLCLHPGIRMRYMRGRVRSYSSRDGFYPLRTHEETMQHARQAEATGVKHVRGIKGVSVFAALDSIDVVRSLDLDSFHCLVNVAKRFYMLWFGKKFTGRPFNILNRLQEVDGRLLAITPTCDISRFPRSLEEHSDYRGHEWYFWIVMYSVPCLKNILPQQFLNHWCLLVYAISILMQNSVSRSDVAYADRYLKQFVSGIDNLYGLPHVTFSVHLLLHLARSTEDFAQPWTHSAFIFESMNGDIKKMVKSSNFAALQIVKGMQLRTALKKMESDLIENMTTNEKRYLQEITTSSKALATPHSVIDKASLLGEPVVKLLPQEYITALRRCYVNVQFDASEPHSIFHRCRFNGYVFHSSQYRRASKQNNSVVLLENGRIFIIKCFVVLYDKACYILGNFIERNHRIKLSETPLPHIIVLKEKEEGILRCLPVTMIESKLLSFSVKLSNQEVLRLACINVLEMEMLS